MSSEPSTPTSARPHGRPAHGGGLRVFVVDGHEDSAASLEMLLGLWGFEVTTAPDGHTALKVLDRFVPDVILLEVLLPGVGGWDLARHIRSRPEFTATRVLMVTSQAREADRRRSQEAGADLHLVKPIDPEALAMLLESFRGT